jgi:endonuclease/exonuclease/phosphatase family metal-dependent hydrolase
MNLHPARFSTRQGSSAENPQAGRQEKNEANRQGLDRRSFLKAAGLAPLLFSSATWPALGGESDSASSLSVMTFNLRYASAQPPHAWWQRRPLNQEVIQSVAPDIIGTQEGVYPQLKDMAADNPDYDWIGLGREGGSHGEFMAIFYRRARFEPMEYDHFWLSDTPEVIGSAHWGNTVKRMATWILFRDRSSKREFYLLNTHLDHQVQIAREKGAKLILSRIEAWKTRLPVIITGDFNAAAGANPVYDMLVSNEAFSDTWKTAANRRGEAVATFHNYKGKNPNGSRIDWILTRGPVTCEAIEINTHSRDGEYPSDHYPVTAWLRFS